MSKKDQVAEFVYIRKYTEYPEQRKVEIEISGDEVTFDNLSKMSELFQTKNINFGSETRHGGYCETCAYTYSVTMIYINDATL